MTMQTTMLVGLVTAAVLSMAACTRTVGESRPPIAADRVPAAHAAYAAPAAAAAMPITSDYQALVDEAHAKFAGVRDGKNADYIPILATIPSELFGVAIATREGDLYVAGDVDYR